MENHVSGLILREIVTWKISKFEKNYKDIYSYMIQSYVEWLVINQNSATEDTTPNNEFVAKRNGGTFCID